MSDKKNQNARPNAFCIRDWPLYFETSASFRIKDCNHVYMPNKHDGKGYARLMRNKKSPQIFSAWCAIIQVASKLPQRGLLVDTDGPLSPEDFSDKTRLPAAIFELAFKVLTEPKIGWIDVIECPDCLIVTGSDRSRGDGPRQLSSVPIRLNGEPARPIVSVHVQTGTARAGHGQDGPGVSVYTRQDKTRQESVPDLENRALANKTGKKIFSKTGIALETDQMEAFMEFWKAFDLTAGRAEAIDAWVEVIEHYGRLVPHGTLERLITKAARKHAQGRTQVVASGGTPIQAKAWLERHRFEDYDNEPPSEDPWKEPENWRLVWRNGSAAAFEGETPESWAAVPLGHKKELIERCSV